MTPQQAIIAPLNAKAPTELAQHRSLLVASFLSGDTSGFLQKCARQLDDYFRESFAESMIGPRIGLTRNPYAIIALGGYGREEQCAHSDVDLLFLFDRQVPPAAEELIREVVYPLWDIGLEVGHATRSFKECMALASKDYEVLTSVLDARFICGVSPLYTKLTEHLRQKLLARQSRKIIDWLIETNTLRHERFGDSAYLLEPNLKEGCGGLRDYHTMLWIARIRAGIKQPRDLEYLGLLSHEEYTRLSGALEFIWQVRNHLHIRAARKCDQLQFDHQTAIADIMGFTAQNDQQPVERFLGRLHRHMETLKLQHLMFLYEMGHVKSRRFLRKRQKHTAVEGLTIAGDNILQFVSPEAIRDNPKRLIWIFEESARLKIPLGTEAKRLVRDFGERVDEAFRTDPEVIQSFERILATPVPEFNVLNEMHNTGFLFNLIPEMKAIEDRIQYDEYHLFPVDKHSLRAVQTLKTFGTPESLAKDPLCDTIYKELKHRKRLLWATLLHDIGKGVPGGGHSEKGAAIVTDLMTRRGYNTTDIDTVTFLVRQHLLLVKVATRRDINDEETAIVCARTIKSVDRLKMLYLLSVADSIATGPKAWNAWMSALIRALFLKVLNILENGELASQETMKSLERKKNYIADTATTPEERADIERLLSVMSPRYLIYADPGQMADHIRLHRELGDRDFVWQVDRSSGVGTRTVTVCAKDRPGLFSKIAGVFTLHNINILDVQVFTWRNNVALDIFEVDPPPDPIFEYERWAKAEKSLADALAGRLDLATALTETLSQRIPRLPAAMDRPLRVTINNDSSSFFTIIEVFANDFPGLLFTITDALFRCRLDVWVAKIATRVDQVVDVFYVRDFDGQKVDAPEQVASIRTIIEEVLGGAAMRPGRA
ncbi:MAG: [protein-PII] uridylyltransferase [Pseudomonadota bacterium]